MTVVADAAAASSSTVVLAWTASTAAVTHVGIAAGSRIGATYVAALVRAVAATASDSSAKLKAVILFREQQHLAAKWMTGRQDDKDNVCVTLSG